MKTDPRSRGRLLIVDDNHDVADVLARILGRSGFEVLVAYDAQGALRIARMNPPRLALLDLGLPDMDGHELARAFRADAELAKTVLVALTGFKPSTRARKGEFAAHLTKPIDFDRLDAILARHAI